MSEALDETAEDTFAAKRWMARHWGEAAAALLLSLMAINLLTSIARKGITNDEIVHIPAGYYHLVGGIFQVNNEHPPLVKMWAALPLVFIQPNESKPSPELLRDPSQLQWAYYSQFWQDNREHFYAFSFWSRAMMVPFAIGLGLTIFFFARELFGVRAAVLAVALYTLEPTMLAHGRIVQTDLPSALAYLLFFFALYRYLQQATLHRVMVLALVSAFAVLIKFSMIVVIPLVACLFVARFVLAARVGERRSRVALHAALTALVVLIAVNAAYYFQSPPLGQSDVDWLQAKAPYSSVLLTGFRVLGKIAPSYFVFGLFNVFMHNAYGHPASLLGMHSNGGWWYYFPVAFALKTTLPFLLLTLAALGWSFRRLFAKRETEFLVLIVPFALYCAFSMTSRLNIGIRHFLPAFPFLIILSAALLDRILRAQRFHAACVALVAIVLCWTAVEVLRSYPHYVSYMNQLASRHPSWQYLSDSNVEWGDDIPALADYLHARGETEVRGAMSGAWGTLYQHGIKYHDLMASPEANVHKTRYVAIGGSFLNGSTVVGDGTKGEAAQKKRVNRFAEFRDRTPEAIFGNSIYLYREN